MTDTSKLNETIKKLTKYHVNNVEHYLTKYCQESTVKTLKNYFQHMSNFSESNESYLAKKKSFNQQKIPSIIKKFDVDWNYEHCKICKLSYWPSNCFVNITPKCHLTKKNFSTYKKYKFFKYKPRYNSYKFKLIKNIVKKGIKIVYKCKSCEQKNNLLKEIYREEMMMKTPNDTKCQVIPCFEIKYNFKKQLNSNSVNLKRKFNSLQIKLKQDELEMQNKNNFLSLSQFLEELT